MSLHDKVIRLMEGGYVECDGHQVRAIEAPSDAISCDFCKMDCLCKDEIAEVCSELCVFSRRDYYLELAEYVKPSE